MKKEELKKILENECSIPKAYYELSSDEESKIIKIICSKLNISTYDASNLFGAYRALQGAKYWDKYVRGQKLKDTTGTYDYSDNFKSTHDELERAYHNYDIELIGAINSIELNDELKDEKIDFNLIKKLENLGVSIDEIVRDDLKETWNLYEKFYNPLIKLNEELDNCILEEQEKNDQLITSLKEYSEYMNPEKLNNYFKTKKLELYRSFAMHFKNLEKFTFFPKKVRDAIGRLRFIRKTDELENDKFLNGEKNNQFVPVFKIDDYTFDHKFEENDKNNISEELSQKIELIEKRKHSAKFIENKTQEINIEYLDQLLKNDIDHRTIDDINLRNLYELYISLNKKSQKVELIREYNVIINEKIIKTLSELASIETKYQSDVHSTFNVAIESLLDLKPHFLKRIIHFRDMNFSTYYKSFIKQIKDFKTSYEKSYFNKKLMDAKNEKDSLVSKKSTKSIFQYISQFISKHQKGVKTEDVTQEVYSSTRRK